MVCCDKLGILTRLISIWVGENHLPAPKVAKLFFVNWVWYLSVLKWLVHNCDMHFAALFWHALWDMLGMQTLFSSAYHL